MRSPIKKTLEPPSLDYSKPQSYTPKFLADKILTSRSSIEGERISALPAIRSGWWNSGNGSVPRCSRRFPTGISSSASRRSCAGIFSMTGTFSAACSVLRRSGVTGGFSSVRKRHLIPADLSRWFGCVLNYTLHIVFYTVCPSKNVILWP